MKKILALSCSPSKHRNSDTMLDYFISGIKEIGKVEIEKIYLEDIKINKYKFENRLGPEKDEKDFANLIEKIKQANGFIIATPTYNFSVPSDLKNFIDRIKFIAVDTKKLNWLGQPTGQLTNLKTYFLVSGGTKKWLKKILFFAFPDFWLKIVFIYYGSKISGSFYSGDINTFQNIKILNMCKIKGKRYANKIF